MPDPIDLKLEERLRELAYVTMLAFRRGGQAADAAHRKTLESLTQAVATEAPSKEKNERYAAAVQRATDWAAVEIEADKGLNPRN